VRISSVDWYENEIYNKLSPAFTKQACPFPEPMVYSFIHISQSPQLRNSALKEEKIIWSLSMEPHADGRPAYNGVQPGSPRGSFMTLLFLLQCHAACSTIFFHLEWRRSEPC